LFIVYGIYVLDRAKRHKKDELDSITSSSRRL
jgi:hypothetical protein